MNKKRLLFIALIFSAFTIHAQENFTFSPKKPKAGEIIEITYTPAGDIANTMGKVEAVVFLSGSKGRKADDLALTKSGKKYTATVKTDTAHTFVQLGFYVDEKKDNNFDNGYFINLYQGDKIRKGSHYNESLFYQFYGAETGVERNNLKALAALEKEIGLYPEQKKALAGAYFRLLNAEKKDEAQALMQKEIESALAAGLKAEADYSYLEMLYSLTKQQDKGKALTAEKKEKFPNGKWVINDFITRFYNETDLDKKNEMLAEIKNNIANNKDWKPLEANLNGFTSQVINLYAKKKDWVTYRKLMAEMPKATIASGYNSIAWDLQGKNEDLEIAEQLAKEATQITRDEWKSPSGPRPDYVTEKNWEKQRESTYAMFADTYAMVLYRLGRYKEGLALAEETALTINKGKDADQNNTYALLAEKVLPANELKPKLEQFVKDGTSTSAVKDALKKLYTQEKNSDAGFDDYIAALGREMHLKMLEELRKSMINETSPAFSLADLDGKTVNIADLKGKVVIVDFWATWCGPCKASFPGMQKMVNKYKDNPNVKFVFIDTWEQAKDKQKNAADFITSNKYTFHVLMDNDNKVVEQFKVDGIPTKFVLDKEGKIRFKSVGFGGSDDKLIDELTAMIEIANGEKTF